MSNTPTNFRYFRLNKVYRFGRSIAQTAMRFSVSGYDLESMVDRDADQKPFVIDTRSQRETFERIHDILNINLQKRQRIAIAAPERGLLEVLSQYLGRNLAFFPHRNDMLRNYNFEDEKRALLITTHSLKGLEFETLIVFGYRNSLPAVQYMRAERRLMQNIFVALTRANENLYIIREPDCIPELQQIDAYTLSSEASPDEFDF